MSDDPELTKNYKPISISGALSSVFKKILCKQINENILSQTLLSNTRFGFETYYSTIDTIFFCLEFSRKSIDRNNIFAGS